MTGRLHRITPLQNATRTSGWEELWEERFSRSDENEAFHHHIKFKSGLTIVRVEGNVLEGREKSTELRRTESVTERTVGLIVLADI